MNVLRDEKIKLLQVMYPLVLDHLGLKADGNYLTADDILDFFALGIAAVLDNDSNFKDARALRFAAEKVGKLIEKRTMEFREASDEAGQSWFSLMIENRPKAPSLN